MKDEKFRPFFPMRGTEALRKSFQSSAVTEVCKSTSIISVDDDSPRANSASATNANSGLAGLQMLHPIPEAWLSNQSWVCPSLPVAVSK